MLKIEKLSEENLYGVLQVIYPGGIITKQKRIKVDTKLMIVDFEVVYNNKIIYVEFDGPTHFTKAKTQIRDYALTDFCYTSNIQVVHIPYFIQLNKNTIKELFGIVTNEVCTEYLSGFHDKAIVYPGDFNFIGWRDFINVIKESYDYMDIVDSLASKPLSEVLGLDFYFNPTKKELWQDIKGSLA